MFLSANVIAERVGRPPSWTVSVVAAVAVTALLAGYGQPTGSRWRVPVEWQRVGHTKFAGLFGFSLGLGFATNLPSVGLPVLVWLGAVTSAWHDAVLLAGAFALGRAAPFVSVVAKNRDREQRWLPSTLRRIDGLAVSLLLLELPLLIALGYLVL